MKIIYFMRHAKSSWKKPVIDYDRGLKQRGKRDAKLIANYLSTHLEKPQIIISSGAKRAVKTAEIVAKSWNIKDIIIDDRLYDSSVDDYLRVVRESVDRYDSVMVVGHNPVISDIVVKLTGDNRYDWLPTSALVGVKCEVNIWSDIDRCKAFFYITPKELRETI